MKKLLSILALALCFVACQNEPFFGDKNSDLVDVVLNIAAPELDATRSVDEPEAGKSSALGAIDFFNEADWAKYDIRYILEVYDKKDNGNGEPIYRERLTKYLDKYAPTQFELRLVPNREYKFVVFADFVEQGTTTDLFYDTTDLRNVTAKTDAEGWNAMNEARDAYFVAENVEVTTGLAKTLTLKRPFAKLRVVTTDLDYIAGYSKPGYVEVTYHTEKVYNSFNAVSGNLNASTMEGAELTYGFEVKKDQPYTEGHDKLATNQTLFADYLFAVEGEQIPVNLKIDVYEEKNGAPIHSHDFNTQIPIQRNYLTTIVGDLLTTQANIAIEIDDNFADEEVFDSANLVNSWGAGQVTTEGNYEFVVATADHNFIVTVNGAAVENGQLKAGTYVYAENATEANQFSAVVSNGAIARLATGISVFGGEMVVKNNDNNYNIDLELNIKDNTDGTESTVEFNYSGNVIFEDVIANPVVTSAVDGNSITFSWDAIEGAISYFYSLNDAEFTETKETSVSFADLAWETTYTFAIYTMGEKNNSVTTTVEATTGVEPIKYNLYLKNEDNWEAVYIYAWGDNFATSEWPGEQMTKTTVDEVEYYVYTLPSEVNGKTINFLFNNGNNGKQTADIEGVVINTDNFYTNYVEPAKPSDLVLYLKPNANWKIDNARFAAYFFGAGETWADMTLVEGETDIYSVVAPAGYPNVIFCRMNPSATANNWGNKWNQTADLTVPTDGTNLYTIADGAWDNGAGTWSTYVVAEPEPVALATPAVTATVDVNVITLTWAAVEGASHYTVQVDDDVEETVNATTYVFEGDYEVEYMFTVKAIAADTAKNVDSEACVVTATTEAEPASGPVAGSEVTVAEFLEMADTENEFVLTGEITRVVNTLYGNFDLTDETGTVYIYGLVTPDGTEKTQWAEAGLREGDTITVKGKYSEYNGDPQISKAVYVSHVAAPFIEATSVTVEAAEVSATIAVSANVAWTVACDAAWVTSYTTSGENNGAIEVVMEANESEEARVATFTFSAEGVEAVTVKLTQKGKPAAGEVVGGNDDFDTISSTNTSYVSGKTTAGWEYKNCAIFQGGTSDSSPKFVMIGDASNRALCMNGKTSAVGSITSPTFSTGCGTLKFNYGLPFGDTKLKFRVDIIQNGVVVKTFTINNASATKLTKYSHEEVLDVAGEFQIVFTNLSPSASTSNKDRTAIWDVEWTGCN